MPRVCLEGVAKRASDSEKEPRPTLQLKYKPYPLGKPQGLVVASRAVGSSYIFIEMNPYLDKYCNWELVLPFPNLQVRVYWK